MKEAPLQDDDAQLASMGHRPELKRQFSTWAMLGLAFAVLNSWTALSASLSISLTSGGSTSVIWGLVTAGFCNMCIASSLAEFLSAYPTAGGQYHWVAVIGWPKWVPILSWVTGWINVAGWVALVATNSLLSSQLIVGIISLMHPSYETQRWHQFLIYIGLTMGAFSINAFMNSILPIIYRGAFTWSIGGFVIVSITVLACSSPEYNSASFVFGNFVNSTGWPDGVAWLLGLLQGGLGVTAFDAVAHMIEEVPNASVEGPKIMVSCVGIGTFTGFIFLIVLLFVAGSMDSVTTSAAGPLLQILYDATKNKAGAICLLMLPLVCLILAILSVMTTSSRMIFAFARCVAHPDKLFQSLTDILSDGGLPASRFFATVHPTLKLPLNALILTVVVVICFGCIFLGSSRPQGPPQGKWKLPNVLGWIADIVALSYIALTTVLFVFPPSSTVTGSSMNYCVAAFAVIIIISAFQWVVDGRKNFTGPRIDLAIDALDTTPTNDTHTNEHEK
ncbi:hypothetical protein N7450_001545 [Penicillium hetheringtonii]|uniref:Uncharacterized protein n=1 Tax=Penicillium hetheringtonii TaxID=911720 RepID=A0AAD6E5K0_9EURO|nr:hypothetical protein N7450_001545 [Penicillium hetheringtonii]